MTSVFLQPGVTLNLFYDGPEPPAGIFDELLDIPYFSKDVSTRSFTSLIGATPSGATEGLRYVYQSCTFPCNQSNADTEEHSTPSRLQTIASLY